MSSPEEESAPPPADTPAADDPAADAVVVETDQTLPVSSDSEVAAVAVNEEVVADVPPAVNQEPEADPEAEADPSSTTIAPEETEEVIETDDVDPSSSIHENPPQSDTPTAPSQQPPPPAVEASTILSPIPKKSNLSSEQNIQSPLQISQTNSFDTSSSLNLPEGVTLPASVSPELINKVSGSLKEAFFQLSSAQMNELLSEYDEALRTKGSEIRNHEAYFFGVLKRYRNLHQRSMADKGMNASQPPQGEHLTGQVMARLDLLVQSGYCTADELDEKVKSKMKLLCEQDALSAIDEINAVPRAGIRSFGSYFIGILNRYARGERQNQRGGNNNHNQRFGQTRYGGQPGVPTDPRFSHYGRSEGSSHHYGRDGSDRKKSRYDSDDRKSSRYRSSDDRDRRHRRRRSRSRSRSYSSSRSSSSEYHRRRRSRSRSRDRSRRHRDSRRSSSHRDSSSKHHASGPYGMSSSQMAPGMLPPPPPPPRPNMPMQMQQLLPGQTPQMMPGMQQQMQQQMTMGQRQGGQYYQQPQQPVYNNNVSQQVQNVNNAALGQALMPSMLGMQAPGRVPGSNAPMSQSQPQVPLDILALADKASQALSNVQTMSNPNFPPPPATSFQQNGFASEKDLSTLVQYALQNLRTTGHVEQQLDGKICSMLKRLPEHAALQALETFSSCDVSKMRSKGGYLAGILKKELVKMGL